MTSRPITKPEQVLRTLVGGEPTAEQVERFNRVKEELGLSATDPVWGFLMAFGWWQALYEQMPEKILAASVKAIESHRESMDTAALQAERNVRLKIEGETSLNVKKLVDMIQAEAKHIDQVSQRKRLTIYTALAMSLATVACAVMVGVGYAWGTAAQSELTLWLKSPEGDAARRMAELNDIRGMAKCERPNRVVAHDDGKRYCMPYDETSKRVNMWRIN